MWRFLRRQLHIPERGVDWGEEMPLYMNAGWFQVHAFPQELNLIDRNAGVWFVCTKRPCSLSLFSMWDNQSKRVTPFSTYIIIFVKTCYSTHTVNGICLWQIYKTCLCVHDTNAHTQIRMIAGGVIFALFWRPSPLPLTPLYLMLDLFLQSTWRHRFEARRICETDLI